MDFSPAAYNARHYLVLPAPVFGNAPAGHSYFQVKMTGLAKLDTVNAAADGSWVRGDLHLNAFGMGFEIILERVASALPPVPADRLRVFVPVQYTVQVTLSAISNTGKWESSGYAVNSFELNRKPLLPQDPNGRKYFLGVIADLSIRDKDGAAQISRVSYDVDMYGYFDTVPNLPQED